VFPNSANLNDNFKVHWTYTNETITFKIEVIANGWVSFGFSPNGGMYNSDLMMAWTAPNGTVMFKDIHFKESGKINSDKIQNWKRLDYVQSNGTTSVTFERRIKICKANRLMDEINIDAEMTQYVIYAWGDNFAGEWPTYHGRNRGSKNLPLLGSLNKKINLDMSQIDTFEFSVNYTLANNIETIYYCQMYQLPEAVTLTKHHLVRYESIISETNRKFVHHWVLYECNIEFETVYLVNNSIPEPGICRTREWNTAQSYCEKTTLAWATGGDDVVDFPEKMGYPLGGSPKKFKYFVIEYHYENTEFVQDLNDQSSVKLYVTRNYRPIEFGVLTTGALTYVGALSIPPKVENLHTKFIVPSEFLNKLVGNNDNITVFAQLPHTHLAGRSFYNTVVRNGSEVEYISNNKYYNNNYQYVNYLMKPVTLKKTDELIIDCVYNTQDRTGFTNGGPGTKNEMCINFLWYYPVSEEFYSCENMIQYDWWYGLFDYFAKNGFTNWVYNPLKPENFFRDGLVSILNSTLLMQSPTYLEQLFQSFYNDAPREIIINGESQNYYKMIKTAPMAEVDVPCKASHSTYAFVLILFCAFLNILNF